MGGAGLRWYAICAVLLVRDATTQTASQCPPVEVEHRIVFRQRPDAQNPVAAGKVALTHGLGAVGTQWSANARHIIKEWRRSHDSNIQCTQTGEQVGVHPTSASEQGHNRKGRLEAK